MDNFFFDIGFVVVASAVLSWFALKLHQPIIIAYIICGVIVGPSGLSLIKGVDFLDSVSRIGITLLLFLAGLVLHPRELAKLFKETSLITLISSVLSFLATFIFCIAWGFSHRESLIIGLVMMFSSTILVVKLLPTITLHQREMGAVSIAILIMQDMLAVGMLMFMNISKAGVTFSGIGFFVLKGVLLVAGVFLIERYILRPALESCETFHETLFLMTLGWCLGVAMLSEWLGYSLEMGAFIAGISLAQSSISLFLSEGLKPFRDFFLVLFFFVLGARMDLSALKGLIVPALLLGIIILVLRPLIFRMLFRWQGREKAFSKEIGFRLGQASEFSLIISVLALQIGQIGAHAAQLVQLSTLFTMIISSYIMIFFYPTPLGLRKGLKQD